LPRANVASFICADEAKENRIVMTASAILRPSGYNTSLTLLSFLLIILAGCAGPRNAVATAPDFVGFITQVIPGKNDDQLDQIVVEYQPNKVVKRFVIPLSSDTALFHHLADKENPAEFEDLIRQQWVHVWFADQLIDDETEFLTASQIIVFDPEDREAVIGGFGRLRGNVSIGPLSPVQREGVVEPTPLPEVYARATSVRATVYARATSVWATSRTIIIYEVDGQTEVKRVQVRPDGTYEIILLNGSYVVDILRSGIESAAELPKTVQIDGGRVTLDIDIDTGIR
jgi:hypothetical protein